MNEDSYTRYKAEADGWLHTGRSTLVDKIISHHLAVIRGVTILEVGAGVGQNIEVLKKYGSVDAIEVDRVGLEELRKRSDIDCLYSSGIPFELNKKYDVICALDVIEHLEGDRDAVHWVCEHLKEGGIFVATVPAFQWFFSDHDRALGHYRRYSGHDFEALFPLESMQIETHSYFNFFLFPLAVVARTLWVAKNALFLQKGDLLKQSSKASSFLEPVLLKILLSEISLFTPMKTRWPFGLSYLVCARRTGQ